VTIRRQCSESILRLTNPTKRAMAIADEADELLDDECFVSEETVTMRNRL
jgi:hypothetical protein